MLKGEMAESYKSFLNSHFEIAPKLWDYCQDIGQVTRDSYILYVTPEGCSPWTAKLEAALSCRTITSEDQVLEPGIVIVPCRPKTVPHEPVQVDVGHLKNMHENHPDMSFAALLTLITLRDLDETLSVVNVPSNLTEIPETAAFLERGEYSQRFCGPFMRLLRTVFYTADSQQNAALRNVVSEFVTNLQPNTTGVGQVAMLVEDIYRITSFNNDFPIKAMKKNPGILAEIADSYIRNEFFGEADPIVKEALKVGFDDVLDHLEGLESYRLTDLTLLNAKLPEGSPAPGVWGLLLAGLYSKNPTNPEEMICQMKALLSNRWNGTGWELIETAQAALS